MIPNFVIEVHVKARNPESIDSWHDIFTTYSAKLFDKGRPKKLVATVKMVKLPLQYARAINEPLHLHTDEYSFELGTVMDMLFDEENNCIAPKLSAVQHPFRDIWFVEVLRLQEEFVGQGLGSACLQQALNTVRSPGKPDLICLYASPIPHRRSSKFSEEVEALHKEKVINGYKKMGFYQTENPQVMYNLLF